SIFHDAVVSVDYAGNIVVVRCLPGMAQAACASLDAMHWNGIVGSLAGEDTFLCITRDENGAIDLVTELKKLLKNG
ncbi:MAG: arginine repressor, partial [Acutalibacteraceae bacterium]